MNGISLTPSELEARVSLSFLRGMEPAMARRMEDAGMMPEDIYSLSRDTLCGQLGVNPKLGYFSDESLVLWGPRSFSSLLLALW